MNVLQAVQDYVSKMLSNIPGMKVFLLDKDTMGIVSMVYTQSQILQKEVYLFERIDAANREKMAHLKAVCFLRPTQSNIGLLSDELRNPKYGEYHIFFTNSVKNAYIEDLAEADENEVVQQLQEFFADYYVYAPDLLTLNVEGLLTSSNTPNPDITKLQIDRTIDGICSCLLSLKRQPYIRYATKSDLAQKVVSELQRRISADPALFDFRKQETSPVLLILDRKDDPVSPLLNQWTYQAMVHELLGIKNNRVNLKEVPGVKKDLQEIVLSAEQDPWFKQTMYLNFGDLGVKIKELVDDYQQKTKSNQNIESLEDIKRFVENYPEFRKLSGNVSKHVTLMGELSRIVEQRALLEVSEIEQDLANSHDHAAHLAAIRDLIENSRVSRSDCLRLVMLYALRYENDSKNELHRLVDMLSQTGTPPDQVALISTLLKYAGSNARGPDMFGNKNALLRRFKSVSRGLKGVQNIYTEHKPFLKEILDQLLANRLKEALFPFAFGSMTKEPPQEVIVFIVGGVTFEESLIVHEFNTTVPGVRIILGGTSVHNSKSFLRDVAALTR